MPRRVSLPAADDLFRPSAPTGRAGETPTPQQRRAQVAAVPAEPDETTAESATGAGRRASGRVRHDEKMTVYVTAEELLDLEHARLSLRRDTGLAVDRGRLVRAAVAMALADLDEHGEDSDLVRRLRVR